MSVFLMGMLKNVTVGEPGPKAVLTWLCDCAGDTGVCQYLPNHSAEPTGVPLAWLAAYTEFSTRTVERHLRALEDGGWIETRQQPGRPSFYQIDVEKIVSSQPRGNPRQSVRGDKTPPTTPPKGAEGHPRQNDGGGAEAPETPDKSDTHPRQTRSAPLTKTTGTPDNFAALPNRLHIDVINKRNQDARTRAGDASGDALKSPHQEPERTVTEEAQEIFRLVWGQDWSNGHDVPVGEALEFAPLVYKTARQVRENLIPAHVVRDIADRVRSGKVKKCPGALFAGILKAWWEADNSRRDALAVLEDKTAVGAPR